MQYSYEIPLMISVTPLMISKIIAINIVKLFFPLSDVSSTTVNTTMTHFARVEIRVVHWVL